MSMAELIDGIISEQNFMGETVTPLEILKSSTQHWMLMELLCMQAQSEFCRNLEKIEEKHGGKKFKVDKWDKDKIPGVYSGGVTCVLEGW